MTTFAKWLEDQGKSAAEAADDLGLSRMAVWRYAAKGQPPTDAIKIRIWQYTGGAVEPNDWFDLDPKHLAAPAPQPQQIGEAA